MKKLLSFFALCAYVMGVIGGIGYACYSHAYLIALCVGITGYLAFPKVKECFHDLID